MKKFYFFMVFVFVFSSLSFPQFKQGDQTLIAVSGGFLTTKTCFEDECSSSLKTFSLSGYYGYFFQKIFNWKLALDF